MRSSLSISLAALLVLATAGCVRRGACPEKGGAPWVEVKGPHFTVSTNLPPDQATEALLALERTRAELNVAGWGTAAEDAPDRVEAVVLADGLEFEELFGRRIWGLFSLTNYPPMIVLYGTPDRWEHRETLAYDSTSSVLRHELTHFLSARFFTQQPRWFGEGLASFLETTQRTEDGKSVRLGLPNMLALTAYNATRSLSVSDAFRWGRAEEDNQNGDTRQQGLYGLSWLLVHWMFNAHPEAFAQFQQRLVEGQDPTRAWAQSFPGWTPATLDVELFQYAKHGGYSEFTRPLPEQRVAPARRTLEDAEIHALRGQLAALGARVAGVGVDVPAVRQRANEELAEALRKDPLDARALRASPGLPVAERLERARQGTTRSPESADAWLLRAEVAEEARAPGDEVEQAYRRTLALDPRAASAAYSLAGLLSGTGRHAEALPFAQAALAIAPSNPASLEAVALALAGLKRCAEARVFEQRTLMALPDGITFQSAEAQRQRLAPVGQACPAGAK